MFYIRIIFAKFKPLWVVQKFSTDFDLEFAHQFEATLHNDFLELAFASKDLKFTHWILSVKIS